MLIFLAALGSVGGGFLSPAKDVIASETPSRIDANLFIITDQLSRGTYTHINTNPLLNFQLLRHGSTLILFPLLFWPVNPLVPFDYRLEDNAILHLENH